MIFERYKHLFDWLCIIDIANLENYERIIENLPVGSIVILRAYEIPHRDYIAFSIARLCRKNRIIFLIASNNLDLIIRSKSNGFHVSEKNFEKMKKWKRFAPHKYFVSASSHDVKKNIRAQTMKIDALMYSPVFCNDKENKLVPMGNLRFMKNVRTTPKTRIFALSGITRDNIKLLKQQHHRAGIASIRLYNHSLWD